MKFKINTFIGFSTMVFPFIVSAAFPMDFRQLTERLMDQIEILPNVIFALTFMFFLYNIMMYIYANDVKKVQEARDMIMYSIIALFVMVSVWGLVAVISNTTGIKPDGGSAAGAGTSANGGVLRQKERF